MELNDNERAVIRLLAIEPVSYFPPYPYELAKKLSKRGLVSCHDGVWHPTEDGLALAKRKEKELRGDAVLHGCLG